MLSLEIIYANFNLWIHQTAYLASLCCQLLSLLLCLPLCCLIFIVYPTFVVIYVNTINQSTHNINPLAHSALSLALSRCLSLLMLSLFSQSIPHSLSLFKHNQSVNLQHQSSCSLSSLSCSLLMLSHSSQSIPHSLSLFKHNQSVKTQY